MNSSSLDSLKRAVLTEDDDGVPGSKLEADPENYTVDQLKRWLRCRGQRLSGKRSELVARVRDFIRSGNHAVLDPSIDGGKWLDAKSSAEKNHETLKASSRNKIPEVPKAGWKKYPSYDIPSQFNYGHVYFYALESLPACTDNPVVDRASDSEEEEQGLGLGHMTDKPFKNGRKYVDSGFVHDVTDNKNEYYFLRAHVWPSMRTDFPHNVLLILSNQSGGVIHASCEPCKASQLGRCSHVVAVLLYLLDHVKKHGPIVSTPCTSQECSWNKGKKRKKNPQRLSSAEYPSKKKKSKVKVIDFDPRPPQSRKVSRSHINNLVRRLQAECQNTGKLSMYSTQLKFTYSDYSQDDICLPVLRNKINILVTNITPMSLSQLPGTEQQSECEKWQSERWFRLTASKCLEAFKIGKLVVDGSNSAASRSMKFISSHMWNMDSENYQSIWMAKGLENEADAIKKYQFQTGHHVEPSGLWVNPNSPGSHARPMVFLAARDWWRSRALKFSMTTILKV